MTLPPTLGLAEASRRQWDVVVVGAGPAGSLAARQLARRRLAVLLVDKAPFPRTKVCGSCLNLRALSILEAVGLKHLTLRLGAVPLTGLRIAAAGRQARLPLPGGVAISREALDTALAEAAVRSGADFLPATLAMQGPAIAGGCQVILRRGCQNTRVVARLVLAADGLGGSFLGHRTASRAAVRQDSRIGAGAIADAAPPFYEPGIIYMACGRSGYVGLVRLEDGRVDIAAAFDPAPVRQAGGPGRLAAATLDQAGLPAVPALGCLAWRGTPRLTRRAQRPAAERTFILGDAASFVEPFTGEGISWALGSGMEVAALAYRACLQWTPRLPQEWSSLYLRTIARRQHACRIVAEVLRYPAVIRTLVALVARAPVLARPVVRYLNSSIKPGRFGP